MIFEARSVRFHGGFLISEVSAGLAGGAIQPRKVVAGEDRNIKRQRRSRGWFVLPERDKIVLRLLLR